MSSLNAIVEEITFTAVSRGLLPFKNPDAIVAHVEAES